MSLSSRETGKVEDIVSKGLKWSSNRLKWVPEGQPGAYIIFDEEAKAARVGAHADLLEILREEWWKKNYWVFSWFGCSTRESAQEFAEQLKRKSYDELWELE